MSWVAATKALSPCGRGRPRPPACSQIGSVGTGSRGDCPHDSEVQQRAVRSSAAAGDRCESRGMKRSRGPSTPSDNVCKLFISMGRLRPFAAQDDQREESGVGGSERGYSMMELQKQMRPRPATRAALLSWTFRLPSSAGGERSSRNCTHKSAMQRCSPEACASGLRFSASTLLEEGFLRRPQSPGTGTLDMRRIPPVIHSRENHRQR